MFWSLQVNSGESKYIQSVRGYEFAMLTNFSLQSESTAQVFVVIDKKDYLLANLSMKANTKLRQQLSLKQKPQIKVKGEGQVFVSGYYDGFDGKTFVGKQKASVADLLKEPAQVDALYKEAKQQIIRRLAWDEQNWSDIDTQLKKKVKQ